MWQILPSVSAGAVWAAAGGGEGGNGSWHLALPPLLRRRPSSGGAQASGLLTCNALLTWLLCDQYLDNAALLMQIASAKLHRGQPPYLGQFLYHPIDMRYVPIDGTSHTS